MSLTHEETLCSKIRILCPSVIHFQITHLLQSCDHELFIVPRSENKSVRKKCTCFLNSVSNQCIQCQLLLTQEQVGSDDVVHLPVEMTDRNAERQIDQELRYRTQQREWREIAAHSKSESLVSLRSHLLRTRDRCQYEVNVSLNVTSSPLFFSCTLKRTIHHRTHNVFTGTRIQLTVPQTCQMCDVRHGRSAHR